MTSLFSSPQPPLPNFSTLLIAGPYHPSAPVHLALSSNRKSPNGKTILFAPSRSRWKDDLERFNDSWLTTHSGNGTTSELASNVTIFYPPTPAHLCLLLSTLQVPNNNAVVPNWASPQTVQATAPNLIILTELSRYFSLSDDGDTAASSVFTIPSYLSLVNRILVLISSLKESSLAVPPKFALFDSGLLDFKMPVSNQPPNILFEDSSNHLQRIQILPVAEKLFEWVGIFEDDSSYVPSSQGEETMDEEGNRRQLRLYRVGKEDDDDVQIINWTEIGCLSAYSKLKETHFKGFYLGAC